MQDENTNANDTDEGVTPETQPDKSAEMAPTLTQDEVNALMGKTRTEARDRARKELLGEVGVENVKDIQGALNRLKKLDEESMSEAERLQTQLDAANAERDAAVIAAKAAKDEAIKTLKVSALKNALGEAKAGDIRDLTLLLERDYSEDIETCFDEEGQPIDDKLEAFVKGLKPKYPKYFGSVGAGSQSNAGGIIPGDMTEAKKQGQERASGLVRP